MTARISIQQGFAETHRLAIANLYDAAFGKKLPLAILEEGRRLGVLADTLSPNFCFVAMANEQPVGVAGFKTIDGSFTGGAGFHQLRARLGFAGSLRAVVVLAIYHRRLSIDELLMDGISVLPSMRGSGIGSMLLARIRMHAMHEGHRFIRLDVINTNPSAKKLYERFGFVATKTRRSGLLGSLLGFESSTTMRCDCQTVA